MSASNRAGAIAKMHTALKKHYKAEPAQPTRPLLEHILYASLLEDCPADLADEGLAKCEQEFFDWNEVRVTTATELSQVLSRLPDPLKAATRLKSNLQSIFEEFYTFDLDHLKKENLGKAVAKFEKMPGMTPFVLNYTIQHGLGGHAIPVDFAAMAMMLVTGITTQTEAVAGRVPGLERAIPKSKAIEFASLLHQAAVALNKDAKDKTARAVLDMVEKGASNRLDDWLVNKVEAKKQRAIQREADRVAAKVADKTPPVVAADKAKASKKVAGKPAPEPSAAEQAAAQKPATGKAAAEKAEAKKAAAKASTSKKSDKAVKASAETTAEKPTKKSDKPAAKVDTAKPVAKKTSEKKSAPEKKSSKTASKTPAKAPEPKSKKSAPPAKSAASKSAPRAKSTPPKSKKVSEPESKSASSKKSPNRKLTKSKPR